MHIMDAESKIYIAGHRGMVGGAILRRLQDEGFRNIITRTRQELDLTRQVQVETFIQEEKPDYIFLAAAKVGGIMANCTYPAEFIHDNLVIQNNVIHAAYKNGVKKLLFLGSSCIYPREAPQPIKEKYLLSGQLEPTNEPYAVAKIAGIKMCQAYNRQYGANFISVMPTNLYGPGDNYRLDTSHVLAALIRKFDEAKRDGKPVVEVWGSGRPLREFLHVDDLAGACLFVMQNYDESKIINIGSGQEVSIAALAALISEIIGYEGKIFFDKSKPDGTLRKLLDSTRINGLGWSAGYSLEVGIRATYNHYQSNLYGDDFA